MGQTDRDIRAVLSIAGSDSSGGAGIQADLKTMTALGVYGMTAVTALTAQNTTGVFSVMNVTPEFLAAQIDAVFSDIVPAAVKIGMLASPELAETAAERLKHYRAEQIVLDPVMVSTSGCGLSGTGTPEVMKRELCPLCRLITPNIPEAEVLLGQRIRTGTREAEAEAAAAAETEAAVEIRTETMAETVTEAAAAAENRVGALSMEEAALRLSEKLGCAVLLKGGHAGAVCGSLYTEIEAGHEEIPMLRESASGKYTEKTGKDAVKSKKYAEKRGAAVDWLAENGRLTKFEAPWVETANTHGTGCTLSSAIACGLAKGKSLEESIRSAKAYLTGALSFGLSLGKGSGTLWHGYVQTVKQK